jgi:hypothetical protein
MGAFSRLPRLFVVTKVNRVQVAQSGIEATLVETTTKCTNAA